MKIYVASSWRNEYQPQVVEALRAIGHEVYDFRNPPNGTGFSWSEVDPKWEQWTTEEYRKALDHPTSIRGFNSDFDGMKWADACVMVLPCGRSANTEAGWMKGAGKKVYVFSPIAQEPELMYKLYDGVIANIDELNNVFSIVLVPTPEKNPVRKLLSLIIDKQFDQPDKILTLIDDVKQKFDVAHAIRNKAEPVGHMLSAIVEWENGKQFNSLEYMLNENYIIKVKS